MLDYLYKWIQNLAFYMVLATALLNVIPGREYQKYIRFYTGLVTIIVLIGPIMKLSGIEEDFYRKYHDRVYEQEMRETREKLKDAELGMFSFICPQENEDEEKNRDEKETIQVGEVKIGD